MIIESFYQAKSDMLLAVQSVLVELIQDAQLEHEMALLAISGGSSPKPLYEAISRLDLNWPQISIALVDERWVDTNHSASNEAFIKTCMTENGGLAVAENIIGLKNNAETAQQGLSLAEDVYQNMARNFDVVLLGMGTDGHTASWFPHAEGLEQALDGDDKLSAVTAEQSDVTGSFTERLTLTKQSVLNAGTVILMISGQDKYDVYQAAKKSPIFKHPVGALLQQNEKDIHVFWSP